ncbi:AAA family ATPase [Xylophilus sp.]|uniref:AAA family ATPase n=1 Tax=Xylophilus sp. TaxID=2653893 RepID=UPI0013BC1B91|nr:histidine kinase [Xylophilus sp.]KAF1046393.1 MAG: hypothetical protein GAK38_02460 [Xylophilus sp.]
MNARHDHRPADFGEGTYLFATENGSRITWLSDAIGHYGAVVPALPSAAVLEERITLLQPQAVFLDFSADAAERSAALVQALRRDWPQLPVLAAGVVSDAASTLAALRAGVNDFVDLAGSPDAVVPTLAALMERRTGQKAVERGRALVVLGARAGLGVTTFATHLAAMLAEQFAPAAQPRDRAQPASQPAPRQAVALLDLGLPARDGLLYLNLQSEFSFVDGVVNLRRLDPTLLQTALAHHGSGAAVLPLPASLAQVREISHAESVSLIRRLVDFFDYQVVDLGGFGTVDFIAQTVKEADRVWVVCDQGIGSIVSTAAQLKELRERGVDTSAFALLVNRYDAQVSLAPRDIASRLGLALGPVLPARHTALLAAANRGALLSQTARSDPYVQALQAIVRTLAPQRRPAGATTAATAADRWSSLMHQITGKWK